MMISGFMGRQFDYDTITTFFSLFFFGGSLLYDQSDLI